MDPRPIRLDRREHPRIIMHPPLVAHLVDMSIPILVVDLSTGGFRAETTEPIATDRTYSCAIRTSAGRLVEVQAKPVYCRPRTNALGFEVGFAFDKTHAPTVSVACALTEQTALAVVFD